MLNPAIETSPADGGINPVSIRIVVDLPAPLGPRNPNTSPFATVNEIPFTAVIRPNDFFKFWTLIIPSLRQFACVSHSIFSKFQVPDFFLAGRFANRITCASPEWRRGRESNPRIEVLQTPTLPLGYPAGKKPIIRCTDFVSTQRIRSRSCCLSAFDVER